MVNESVMAPPAAVVAAFEAAVVALLLLPLLSLPQAASPMTATPTSAVRVRAGALMGFLRGRGRSQGRSACPAGGVSGFATPPAPYRPHGTPPAHGEAWPATGAEPAGPRPRGPGRQPGWRRPRPRRSSTWSNRPG